MYSDSINNEKELLALIAVGDETAFRELFTFYQPRLFTAALRMTGDANLAKDIYQDIFLKVWLNRTTIAGMENFPGWLFTVARNHIYDTLKRTAQKRSSPLDAHRDNSVDTNAGPELLLQGKEYRQVLQSAVKLLPDKQRETWQLIKQHGMSRNEVAEKMNISPETVKSNLETAQRKIRAFCLKELGFIPVAVFIALGLK